MKILGIKTSAQFKKISKDGKKFHAKSLLVLASPTITQYLQNKDLGQNAADFVRVGFTVSKIVGNAVARNYAKRKLREAARALLLEYGKNHHDYVVIAKKEIANATYEEILRDLKFCLKRL